ncbi:MAG: 16S rRNA (guanine(527)-N(7))-methyltransferase RsmG [Oryzihumus sp.]
MSTAPPPATPAVAVQVFGDRLPQAEVFTALLSDSGVSHGLVGPREVPRLWERHVLNCAVVQEAIPAGVRLIDVGSGAGLPGLALAIARPDLDVHLVEPMLRRTTWLTDAVQAIGLDNVTVHRGRAEQFWGDLAAPVVTARAVARLAELARWCLPLLEPEGTLLALKGESAPEELAEDEAAVRAAGAVSEEVRYYGGGVLDPLTTVVHVRIGATVPRGVSGANPKAGGRRKNRRRR